MPVPFAMKRFIRRGLLYSLPCLLMLTGCGLVSQQRTLYDSSGIQVGIVTDRSTDEHASPPVQNRHPADYSPRDIRSLIGSLEVSGYSGIVIGIFSSPHPIPVFTEAEILLLAEPLSAAFRQASPRERVFFSLQNPNASYETDRTSGSLFFRDDYLYVILTDHYALLKADPGGGENRDPRDTKGMKLWLAGSAQAAAVPDGKEPHWDAFEKVHISLKPAEVLTAKNEPQKGMNSTQQVAATVAGQQAAKPEATPTNASDQVNDLRLQVRELTSANLDLRSQLKEQSNTIEKLKSELDQLRNELQTGTKSDRKPPRKQTAP